jgi:predicted transcriptional regulator
MSKHRAQEEIIAEMLSIVLKKAKKTHIMYRANLSYTLLCKYLDLLIDNQLIKYNEGDKTYEVTTKGETYLDRYAEYKTVETTLLSSELEYDDKKASLFQLLGED